MKIVDDGERELMELHTPWFAAAAAKDLDASMQPIASEIVSYEHAVPLQVTDIEGIRAERRRNFELEWEEFAWTVPDLRIQACGDLTVAWGLEPDGEPAGGWHTAGDVVARNPGLPAHQR